MITAVLLATPFLSFAQTSKEKDTVIAIPNDSYDNFPNAKQSRGSSITISEAAGVNLENIGYLEITSFADSLFFSSKYELSLKVYLFAFQKNNDKGQVVHRYRSAICYAMANDSAGAFHQLFRIAEKGKYYNYHEIEKEQAFEKLRKDNRWSSLMNIIERNALELGEKFSSEVPIAQ